MQRHFLCGRRAGGRRLGMWLILGASLGLDRARRIGAAAMVALACAAPARAADFNWIQPGGGPFFTPVFWQPFVPPFGPFGPGGAGDTVKFDLDIPPVARYTILGVAGENDRLLVGNDSLRLSLANGPGGVDYELLNLSKGAPSFTVGLAAGDVGDVLLTGENGTALSTKFASIGHAAGSVGRVTVEQCNGSAAVI